MTSKIIIDATDAPLGRLASYAAKQALLGKDIIIINCNKAIVSGNKSSIIERYREYRKRGGSSLKGPHFPKSPERIVKRTVRGMLSYQEGRGRMAFKKVICHDNTPVEYKESQKIGLQKQFKINSITLNELSERI